MPPASASAARLAKVARPPSKQLEEREGDRRSVEHGLEPALLALEPGDSLGLAGELLPHLGEGPLGAHAGQELAGGKSFDQVVVGAGLNPLDARLLAGSRGDNQDREGPGPHIGAQAASSSKPPMTGIIASVITMSGRRRRSPRGPAARRRARRPRSCPGAFGRCMRACRRCRRRGRPAVQRPRGRPGGRRDRLLGGPRAKTSIAYALADRGGAGLRARHLIRRQVRVATGDRHGEGGPHALRALDAEGPAVQPHELIGQREPDPGALLAPCASAVDAVEPLEIRGSSASG